MGCHVSENPEDAPHIDPENLMAHGPNLVGIDPRYPQVALRWHGPSSIYA